MFEDDFPLADRQLPSPPSGMVERMGRRQGVHTRSLWTRRCGRRSEQGEADPAGHLRESRNRHRGPWRRHRPPGTRPPDVPDAEAPPHKGQRPGCRQGTSARPEQRETRRNGTAVITRRVRIAPQRGLVLRARARGEELHRLDVGDRNRPPARHHGPGGGPFLARRGFRGESTTESRHRLRRTHEDRPPARGSMRPTRIAAPQHRGKSEEHGVVTVSTTPRFRTGAACIWASGRA